MGCLSQFGGLVESRMGACRSRRLRNPAADSVRALGSVADEEDDETHYGSQQQSEDGVPGPRLA
ncbi:hypothetical protein EDD91_1711 [Streptomyces sp. KS 21]|nr:hypothetical protein EDD91_1711 [Streptomyces sp. KS 21]